MRIDEVVRVQNPMGGDYKSQLDRDRAAAAVRAQRQANRENGKNVAGSKSGTDPQGGMFTPGAVTTKSYNNALTKQFARPAGQGKGVDIMGNPLKRPETPKVEPTQQTPEPTQQTPQPTQQTPQPTQTMQPKQSWVGQDTDIPAVQRKQQSQQNQPSTTQPVVAKTPNFSGGSTGYSTANTTFKPPVMQPAAQTTATAGTSAPATAPTTTTTTVPQQSLTQQTGRPNPYMTPPANTPSEPALQTQTMPSEPVKIGGQKLNPNDPADAKMLQMIQKQLPQMPTPQVAAVKQVADKTLATRRRNKPKKRF
jgi:hypothetical protein